MTHIKSLFYALSFGLVFVLTGSEEVIQESIPREFATPLIIPDLSHLIIEILDDRLQALQLRSLSILSLQILDLDHSIEHARESIFELLRVLVWL